VRRFACPDGEPPAGHRQRQLDGVWRIRGHEVNARFGQRRQERQRVADVKLATCRVERADAGGIGRPQVGEERPGAATLRQLGRDDVCVDRGPAGVQLEPERAARPSSDCRAKQRPADSGERVQDQLARPGEEFDQSRHQPRRLVGAVRPAQRVPKLGRVCRGQDRLREVEPFFPGQLVERIGGMGLLSHPASLRSAVGRGP